MPGGAGRPRRACACCKWHKYLGNSRWRRSVGEQRVAKDHRQQIRFGRKAA